MPTSDKRHPSTCTLRLIVPCAQHGAQTIVSGMHILELTAHKVFRHHLRTVEGLDSRVLSVRISSIWTKEPQEIGIDECCSVFGYFEDNQSAET